MARPALDVWLYGVRIGTLSEPKPSRMRFQFTTDVEDRFRAGSPVLSVSMPIDAGLSPRSNVVRAFFAGLLPEGDAREAIFDEFSVQRNDNYGLLAAIGRECAGAVVIQPDGAPPPGTTGHIDELTDTDLERLLARLKERPLGADPDEDVRVSMSGVQEKLLLARTLDGKWGRPAGGAPSTHILKPQDMRLMGYAAAEDFCLRLARSIGLTTVESDVIEVDGRPILVVSRYDRQVTDVGTIQRIHQEDMCQALSVDGASGGDKYQDKGGPSLKEVASVLDRFAQPEEQSKLLALTTLNVAIGNADAHAKNISLLHPEDGTIALAPAYDITPTTYYRKVPTSRGLQDLSDKLGMWVNHERSIHKITTEDLVTEAGSWGMPTRLAEDTVSQTLSDLTANMDRAASDSRLPPSIRDFVANRVEALEEGSPAGRHEDKAEVRR